MISKRRELDTESNNDMLFSNKEIIQFTLIFIGIWALISIIFNILGDIFKVGVGTFFPVGKFEFIIPSFFGILIAISIFCGFIAILKYYSKFEYNLIFIILIGIALIISTSVINGIWKGFVSPTEGSGGLIFYWDAIEIESRHKNVYEFISNYEEKQNGLEYHSRTHPPGAVLLYYILYKIFYFSALISIVICIISASFSAYFLKKIFKREVKEEISFYIPFLFLLLPAIQIYYLANLYAIITTLIIMVIYFYRHANIKISLIATITCLFLIAFMTFMVVFILGVLFCFELLRFYNSREIKNFEKLYVIFLSLFCIYVLFLIIFRFNYINSFLFASKEENPYGFMLIATPYEYFITRVEDILEIVIYFGPFMIILFIRGFPIMKKEYPDLYLLTISSLIILISLFLLGVYRTGETARACTYIYPFLLFPVGIWLSQKNLPIKEKKALLILVFIQTIIMQTFGYYKW